MSKLEIRSHWWILRDASWTNHPTNTSWSFPAVSLLGSICNDCVLQIILHTAYTTTNTWQEQGSQKYAHLPLLSPTNRFMPRKWSWIERNYAQCFVLSWGLNCTQVTIACILIYSSSREIYSSSCCRNFPELPCMTSYPLHDLWCCSLRRHISHVCGKYIYIVFLSNRSVSSELFALPRAGGFSK